MLADNAYGSLGFLGHAGCGGTYGYTWVHIVPRGLFFRSMAPAGCVNIWVFCPSVGSREGLTPKWAVHLAVEGGCRDIGSYGYNEAG